MPTQIWKKNVKRQGIAQVSGHIYSEIIWYVLWSNFVDNKKSENEFPISHQNAAGHTLRSDFFRLDEDEVEAITQQSNPEYASFTLDGKGTLYSIKSPQKSPTKSL